MSHSGFRYNDYDIWQSFWISLNGGWHDMNYKWEFEEYWGKGAKVEKTILSPEDFDDFQKKLAEPPDPKVVERFRNILNKPALWND
tara:strand:- start:1113 stop:1370 length:258 start_codon:yes stop_codon:yes gene_type:complete